MRGSNILPTNVLYVPSKRRNLVSMSALTNRDFKVCFVLGNVTIRKYGKIMFERKFIKKCEMFILNEINKSLVFNYFDYSLSINVNV